MEQEAADRDLVEHGIGGDRGQSVADVVVVLGQDFVGYFAWHYPPPFLFVASLLAMLALITLVVKTVLERRLDEGQTRDGSGDH